MKYLPDTDKLCLEYPEITAVMGIENYKKSRTRGSIIVHGRGGNGNLVLVEFETLPKKYKEAVVDRFGDPYAYFAKQPLLAMLKADLEARAFYAGYKLQDGRSLPMEYQSKYIRQSEWLKMIGIVLADKKELKEVLKISIGQFWDTVIALHRNDAPVNPDLPTSEKRMRERLKVYQTKGLDGLVETHRFNNSYARKVDTSIERLILSLYRRHDKPYITTVCEEYKHFIAGNLEVVDLETGEVFNPADYLVNGKPYQVYYATVKHYIEKPVNRAILDKYRMSQLEYSSIHRPHFHRKAPEYSLSKITMDDISIPFKMHNGQRAWSYQVFDVASQAVIGVSFARDKSANLVMDALRDMFSMIARNDWGMPAEIEVEQHLNSDMKGSYDKAGTFHADILTEGNIFPFVRFCASRNPQEKRAEGFINRKKYDFQKQRPGFLHRPFARKEANRQNEDSKDVFYTYDQIRSNELADIAKYNNELHPKQDKYPGLTRWQVLEQTLNPNLLPVNMPLLLQYVGNTQETSIRRGSVELQYGKYFLKDQAIWQTLPTNRVMAHYLTNRDNEVEYVHLFTRDGDPLCEAVPVERFNESRFEQTSRDKEIMSDQAHYIKGWEKIVKEKGANLLSVQAVNTRSMAQVRETAEALANSTDNEPIMPEKPLKEVGVMQKSGEETPYYMDDKALKSRAVKGI